MAKELGNGYSYKKVKINYPNGDIYEGMGAAYYDSEYEPHGIGTYFHKESGVSFKADWELRAGPDFKTIEIVNKPNDKFFVLVQVYAGEIYTDLSHLNILEAIPKTFVFKELPSIIIEPHAWLKHLFTIKKVTEEELTFDFTGPKVDHGNFVDIVVKKGEPQSFKSSKSTTIIWDHGDEYDATQTASIDILYF